MADIKEKAIAMLHSESGLNLNNAAENTLFYCPTGKRCVITEVVVVDPSANVSTVDVSAGWNTANADDVVALTGALTISQDNYKKLTVMSNAAIGEAGEAFKFEVQTPEGGAATGTVLVFGYQFDA